MLKNHAPDGTPEGRPNGRRSKASEVEKFFPQKHSPKKIGPKKIGLFFDAFEFRPFLGPFRVLYHEEVRSEKTASYTSSAHRRTLFFELFFTFFSAQCKLFLDLRFFFSTFFEFGSFSGPFRVVFHEEVRDVQAGHFHPCRGG